MTGSLSSPPVEQTPLSSIKSAPGNARRHPKKQVRQIAESITKFGFNNPILIDEDGAVIAGHGRLLAAHLLGLQSAPTLRISNLTEDQKRAYRLADNQIALQSNWDKPKLRDELITLRRLDFDMSELGFDVKRLEPEPRRQKGRRRPHASANAPGAAAPTVWAAGAHRIALAGCDARADITALLGGDCPSLILASCTPPEVFKAALGALTAKTWLLLFAGANDLAAAITAACSVTNLVDACSWLGPSYSDQSGPLYRDALTHVLIFGAQGGTQSRIDRPRLWTYESEITLPAGSPPSFPSDLITDIVGDYTAPGDVVLAGPGFDRALEAAGSVGAACRLLTASRAECNCALQRLEALTGEAPKNVQPRFEPGTPHATRGNHDG